MPKSRVRRKRERKQPRVVDKRRSPLADLTLPEITFPADIVGTSGPERTELTLDLVLAGRDPRSEFRVPLHLQRRIVADSRIELWGLGLGGVFGIHLVGQVGPKSEWRMQSRVVADQLHGSQMLDVLDMLDAVREATKVGLTESGAIPQVWGAITSQRQEPPALLRSVVEAHAAIERNLGINVAAPETYTGDDVRDTLETASLLRGDVVAQTWRERTWRVTDSEANDLLSGAFADAGAARMELEEHWHWAIAGREIPVGRVLVTYESVTVVREAKNTSAGERTLVLAPGPSDKVTYRLVAVGDDHELETGPSFDQRWFWESSWQARELEVDTLIEAGAVSVHDDLDGLFDHLDRVANSGEAD